MTLVTSHDGIQLNTRGVRAGDDVTNSNACKILGGNKQGGGSGSGVLVHYEQTVST